MSYDVVIHLYISLRFNKWRQDGRVSSYDEHNVL